jgi:hypothetical protein
MGNKEYYKSQLMQLKEQCEEIEANWSGKEAGKQEENAHIASEIKEHADQIIYLLDTLN